MAVKMVSTVRKMLKGEFDNIATRAMLQASGNAPYDSGNLAASIEWHSRGFGKYTVKTNAVGSNGVAYPARIEAGDPVFPNQKRQGWAYYPRGIWYHNQWHSSARASSKSHFMEKTVENFRI